MKLELARYQAALNLYWALLWVMKRLLGWEEVLRAWLDGEERESDELMGLDVFEEDPILVDLDKPEDGGLGGFWEALSQEELEICKGRVILDGEGCAMISLGQEVPAQNLYGIWTKLFRESGACVIYTPSEKHLIRSVAQWNSITQEWKDVDPR